MSVERLFSPLIKGKLKNTSARALYDATFLRNNTKVRDICKKHKLDKDSPLSWQLVQLTFKQEPHPQLVSAFTKSQSQSQSQSSFDERWQWAGLADARKDGVWAEPLPPPGALTPLKVITGRGMNSKKGAVLRPKMVHLLSKCDS